MVVGVLHSACNEFMKATLFDPAFPVSDEMCRYMHLAMLAAILEGGLFQ